MNPLGILIALAVVSASRWVRDVEAFADQSSHDYYSQQPRLCPRHYDVSFSKTCNISSCYFSQTYAHCCLRNAYGSTQCICSLFTTCAPRNVTIDNLPPQIALSYTTATTPTTTSTTTTTVTPSFRSFCDNGTLHLNDPLSDCASHWIAKITMSRGGSEVYNTVYAPATVSGVYKPTFITVLFRKNMAEAMRNESFDLQIGGRKYPLIDRIFNMMDGPNGIAFIDINMEYAGTMSNLRCQKGACPYNKATMLAKVNLGDCKIVSWGDVNTASLSSGGLHEANVTIHPTGCADITDLSGANNTVCFHTITGDNLACASASGSPVYCKTPSNGEWILYGVLGRRNKCNTSPEVKVIPYPG